MEKKKGFDRTLKIIDSLGFVRTGAFYNQTDKQKNNPMIIAKNGFKIAVFNYTYGYNNDVHLKENIINIIDKNEIIKDLKKIEGNKFDAKIVFFHWGNEYERLPDTVQQDLAAFCFDNGFDIIIGSHPHVIQPMQFIDYQLPDGTKKKVFIAYSLGNYVSNYGVWRYCDGGALVQLNLVKKNNKVEIVAPKYHLIWV
jgi:poly-gamma-glutamate synthesis protein (capsule biosynthesis protein)